MAWLDLEELPQFLGPSRLLRSRRWAAHSFQPENHLDAKAGNLAEATRSKIQELGGDRPVGPIRLLTQLRCFGYYFSPLNLFYAFDAGGKRVEQVLAEVNNTPWGDRHFYLLDRRNQTHSEALRFAHGKDFHVSPFMGMEAEYHWRLSPPGETLTVGIASLAADHRRFDACMTMKRRPFTRRELTRLSIRRPLATAQIVAAIYYQALLLWWNRCPFHPHPQAQ